jgi:hypothetical protein
MARRKRAVQRPKKKAANRHPKRTTAKATCAKVSRACSDANALTTSTSAAKPT